MEEMCASNSFNKEHEMPIEKSSTKYPLLRKETA
jgi:hypothetical protein